VTDPVDDQPEPSCVVCRRRDARHGDVCGPCRTRIDEHLVELVERWAILPAALEPGRAGDDDRERVSGSRERPLPGGEALNLVARGNVHTRQTLKPTDPYGPDQHGPVDPAEILWSWTRDWILYRRKGETGPGRGDLVSIVTWLRPRLEWACDRHPAIADFAAEVSDAVDALRGILNVRRYVQRFKEPCPRCDTKALYREVDPDMQNMDPAERAARSWVECGSCHNLWRESEFARLSIILDTEARRAA